MIWSSTYSVPADGSGERFSLSYSNAFMVMTDDPEKQEGLAKFMAFWLSPKFMVNGLELQSRVFSFQSPITPKPTGSCFPLRC